MSDKPWYIIIHASSLESLEKKVNDKMKLDGYIPHGNLTVVTYTGGAIYKYVREMVLAPHIQLEMVREN